jgi:hypothetical protein
MGLANLLGKANKYFETGLGFKFTARDVGILVSLLGPELLTVGDYRWLQ